MIAATGLVAVAFAACTTELGPQPPGQPITGTIQYDGTAMLEFESPVLLVVAILSLSVDDVSTPYAMVSVPNPDFGEPIPYRLEYLPAYDYFLVASVMDEGVVDPNSQLVGTYPDACVFVDPPSPRPVVVTADAPTQGIDIVIRDDVMADPCFGGSVDTGTEVLVTLVSDDLAPEPGDVVSAALFESFPPVPPPDAAAMDDQADSFPVVLSIDDVPAGEYYLVGCFDRGGDSELCDGEGDRTAFYMDFAETLTVEGEWVEVALEL